MLQVQQGFEAQAHGFDQEAPESGMLC